MSQGRRALQNIDWNGGDIVLCEIQNFQLFQLPKFRWNCAYESRREKRITEQLANRGNKTYEPVSWFPLRRSSCKFESLPSSTGIEPRPEGENARVNHVATGKIAYVPVSWFLKSLRSFKSDNWPNFTGIEPLNKQIETEQMVVWSRPLYEPESWLS